MLANNVGVMIRVKRKKKTKKTATSVDYNAVYVMGVENYAKDYPTKASAKCDDQQAGR